MKKKIFKDILINIISSAIPIVILQLIIMPYISGSVSSDNFGLIITFISLLNIVPATIGNTLNNIRLISNLEYREKGYIGDFNVILCFGGILNLIFMTAGICYFDGSFKAINLSLIIIAATIQMINNYFIVAFRIKLNFVHILLNNLILSIGHLIGTWLFMITSLWQLIYICGYLFSLIFIFTKTDIWKEPFNKTPFFINTSKETVFLLLANILNRLLNYSDKLIIYPLIGGTFVAIYYVATFFTKIVSLVITPINGVALSYLSKIKNTQQNLFKYTFLGGSVFCFLGYIICIVISRPVLSIIYPQYVDEAMSFIYLTSATTAIMVLNSIVVPFVLKYCKMKWQMVINGVTLFMYLTMALLLYKSYGLMGFCIASLVSRIIQLAVSLFIYITFHRRDIIDPITPERN